VLTGKLRREGKKVKPWKKERMESEENVGKERRNWIQNTFDKALAHRKNKEGSRQRERKRRDASREEKRSVEKKKRAKDRLTGVRPVGN